MFLDEVSAEGVHCFRFVWLFFTVVLRWFTRNAQRGVSAGFKWEFAEFRGMNNVTRLSWNQIRANAAGFAEEWKDARYERDETQSYYNNFFEVWGVKRRKVASFEEPVKKLGGKEGFIDLFWKGVLLVEQKSAGRKLEPAKTQALEYFPGLIDSELPRTEC